MAELVKRHFACGGDDERDSSIEEKITSEDSMWSGLIFNVNRLQVELPNGDVAARDCVRHPGASAIVAVTDDGFVCLVRQYRACLGRVTVEIPAGKLDIGEDPLVCAKRELKEETGIIAGKMAELTSIFTTCGFSDELIHIYMATELTFSEAHPDDDEFLNVDLVPISEFIDAVLDGKVEDAKTVVGALALDAIMHRI